MSARTKVAEAPTFGATRHAGDHPHVSPGLQGHSAVSDRVARTAGAAVPAWVAARPGPAAGTGRASGGACAAGLGNPANNAATAGQKGCEEWASQQQRVAKQRRSREGRFFARRWLRQVTTMGRVAWCGKASRMPDGSVALKYSENGSAGLGGVQTCGSLWACPVCSAKITSRRTTDVEKALAWNASRRGTVALLTLTMRHHSGNRLKTAWDAISGAWRAMTNCRAWKDDRKALGLDHYIRATEVTHGENGWHVHLHVLLFFDGPVSREMVEPAVDGMFERWNDALHGAGFEASREHGIDIRFGTGALDGLGKYLSKLTYEAVGGRWKNGRKGGRTPFELLHDALEIGLASDFELWWEWEKASKGRRQLTWSRGLKKVAGIDDTTDEEIAAEDDDGDTVLVMPKRTWQQVEPQVEDLLAYTEQWGADGAMRWLDSRGLRYRLPGDEPQSADLWDAPDPEAKMQ